MGVLVPDRADSAHPRAPHDRGRCRESTRSGRQTAAKSHSTPLDGVFKRRIDQPGRTTLFASPVTGVEDWTYDGRFVIVGLSAQNVSALPLGGDQKPFP